MMKPKNFEALKILRNAPPSNIIKTKSQKVKATTTLDEEKLFFIIDLYTKASLYVGSKYNRSKNGEK